MDTIRTYIQRILELEPALVIATVSGLLAIAANFGFAPAVDVPAAVMTGFNLLILVATVLGIRQSVYSPATHEKEVAAAYIEGIEVFDDNLFEGVEGGG